MALRISRYSKIYLQMARPDVAQDFPRHVFVREPNKPSYKTLNFNRPRLYVKHENVLDSTIVHLTERFTNTEIFLIGTLNTSDLLAKRTQQLMREYKPDVVFIQANEEWGQAARMMEYAKSQQEMNLAVDEMKHITEFNQDEGGHTLAFKIRWRIFKFLFYNTFALPTNWNPMLPGLEMKFALEEANKAEAKVVFLGQEFDQNTWHRLLHERRNSIISHFFRYIRGIQGMYLYELYEFKAQLHSHGLNNFVESSMDQYTINWIIQLTDILFPEVKRIMVDKKDEDIYRIIHENKGKRMVAVVNQHHLEGIEHHWCHEYGQVPRNQPFEEMDPIGDMDLRRTLFEQMYHVLMREVKSSYFKVTPASFSNMMTPYTREANFNYEHRNM